MIDAIDLCLGARRSAQFTDADFHNLDVTTPIRISLTIGELDDPLKAMEGYGMFLRGFHAATGEIEDEPERGAETVLTLTLTVAGDLEPNWTLESERAAAQSLTRNRRRPDHPCKHLLQRIPRLPCGSFRAASFSSFVRSAPSTKRAKSASTMTSKGLSALAPMHSSRLRLSSVREQARSVCCVGSICFAWRMGRRQSAASVWRLWTAAAETPIDLSDALEHYTHSVTAR